MKYILLLTITLLAGCQDLYLNPDAFHIVVDAGNDLYLDEPMVIETLDCTEYGLDVYDFKIAGIITWETIAANQEYNSWDMYCQADGYKQDIYVGTIYIGE